MEKTNNMEKTWRDRPPLIETRPSAAAAVVDERKPRQQDCSETNECSCSQWKMPLDRTWCVCRMVGYQNRDFRTDGAGNHHVIPPELYRQFEEAIYVQVDKSVSQSQIWNLLILLAHCIVPYRLPFFDIKSVPFFTKLGILCLPWIFTHFVGKYFIFNPMDEGLIDLMKLYQLQFQEYGVTMEYRRGSNGILRWYHDDAGICLCRRRRPTSILPTAASAAAVGSGVAQHDDDRDEIPPSPPIYINIDMPGNLHIEEENHDPSMKVDAKLWSLLQSTHKELNPTKFDFSETKFSQIWSLIFCLYHAISFSFSELPYSPRGELARLAFHAMLYYTLLFIMRRANNDRAWRSFLQVLARVNTALQKDPTMAHLKLEFYHQQQQQKQLQWYQFVRQRPPPPPPPKNSTPTSPMGLVCPFLQQQRRAVEPAPPSPLPSISSSSYPLNKHKKDC